MAPVVVVRGSEVVYCRGDGANADADVDVGAWGGQLDKPGGFLRWVDEASGGRGGAYTAARVRSPPEIGAGEWGAGGGDEGEGGWLGRWVPFWGAHWRRLLSSLDLTLPQEERTSLSGADALAEALAAARSANLPRAGNDATHSFASRRFAPRICFSNM